MVKRKRNLLTERKKYLKLTLKNVCVYANVFSVQSHISLISDCSSIPRGPVTYNVTRRTRYRTRLLYIEFANDIQKNINMNDSKDLKKRYFLRFLRTHTHTYTLVSISSAQCSRGLSCCCHPLLHFGMVDRFRLWGGTTFHPAQRPRSVTLIDWTGLRLDRVLQSLFSTRTLCFLRRCLWGYWFISRTSALRHLQRWSLMVLFSFIGVV